MNKSQKMATVRAKSAYTMRRRQTEEAYRQYRKTAPSQVCPLCDGRKILKRWKYWMIVENHYPYDLVAGVSHLLITTGHSFSKPGRWLSGIELYWKILPAIRREGYYTIILENLVRRKTVPGHAHWHLLVDDNLSG